MDDFDFRQADRRLLKKETVTTLFGLMMSKMIKHI